MSADGGAFLAPARIKLKPRIIGDLFCGAGGLSTGAQRAMDSLGQPMKLVAVNHWPLAIETNRRNHPEHADSIHCAEMETARPLLLVPGGYLDLLMAAPSCVFHSRARGGKPVNDQQRMDPWHVVRWCTELRVKRILVENVPEFRDWGPCDIRTGRPIPSRKGEYFRAWLAALKAIGMRLDYRVICMADYGDPTTRERFMLIGRSDGKPLRWPEPTHSKAGSSDLLGQRARWRSAADDVIDWTKPGKSIFNRKKPLKPNTIRRILAGAVRYHWPQVYVDALQALLDGRDPKLDITYEEAARYGIQLLDCVDYVQARAAQGEMAPIMINFRGTAPNQIDSSAQSTEEPLRGLTAGGGHVGLIMSTASGGAAREVSQPVPTIMASGNGAAPHFIEPLIISKHGGPGNNARGTGEPMFTADTAGAGSLAQPLIAPYYGGGSGLTAKPASEPLPAMTTKGRFGLVLPTTHQGDARVRSADESLPTITGANRGELGVSQAIVLQTSYSGVRMPTSSDDPLRSVTTAKGGDMALAEPFLVPNFGEREGQEPRTHDINGPVPAITASGHIQLAVPAAQGCRIDILYRMLNWRELARGTSFDDEGQIYDFAGNGTEITKQIGNAVPCRTAKALVRALMEC